MSAWLANIRRITDLRCHEGNQNVETTTLHVQHTFWNVHEPHEHDMKLPNFTSYEERTKTEQMSSSILNLDIFHKNLTPGELSCICQI